MVLEPIPADQLPKGASMGVQIDGVAVYRTATTWTVDRDAALERWAFIQRDLEPQEGDRVLSGSFPGLNWSGEYTREQADRFTEWRDRLVRAARRATRAPRAEKREARAAALALGPNTIRIPKAALS